MQQLRKLLLLLPTALFLAAPNAHSMSHVHEIRDRIKKRSEELFQAVKKRDIKHARKLIGYVADVNIQYENGHTPLHLAASSGQTEMVQLLIENGANVNAKFHDDQDFINVTPLHLAALEGHQETVQLLIKNDANVNAQFHHKQDFINVTPLDVALVQGHSKVIQSLEQHGASPSRYNHPQYQLAQYGTNIIHTVTGKQNILSPDQKQKLHEITAHNMNPVAMGLSLLSRQHETYTPARMICESLAIKC